jgi:Ca2+-binding RTX toxin-like protein
MSSAPWPRHATYHPRNFSGWEVCIVRRFVVLGLVVPFLLLPVDTATSAVATCQGEEATIVGEPGEILRGTDGDDVIVNNGATFVLAGDGADLVCMTNEPRAKSTVSGQAGDDAIVVVGGKRTLVYPGDGSDMVTGSAGQEKVYLGDEAAPAPSGRDVIRTRGGRDIVRVLHTGEVHDLIDVGGGDDQISSRSGNPLADDGGLVGGAGRDHLDVLLPEDFAGEELVVDNERQLAAVDGTVTHRWSGFESFRVWRHPFARTVFVGTSASEQLTAAFGDEALRAEMGAGDDKVSLDGPPRTSTTIAGGRGKDQLTIKYYGNATADLDVARGSVVEKLGNSGDVAFAAVERFDLDVRRARMVGDNGPDYFKVSADRAVLRGGGGKDHLACWSVPLLALECTGLTLMGNAGSDTLYGGPYRDDLVGGPGRDRGDGRQGSDRCVSIERRTSCERG